MPRIALEEVKDVSEGLSGLGVCSFSTLWETDVLIRF